MVPVRDAGHHELLEIVEDGINRFPSLWRLRRQGVAKLVRPGARAHGILLGVAEVVCDPIDGAGASALELLQRHVAESTHVPSISRACLGAFARAIASR